MDYSALSDQKINLMVAKIMHKNLKVIESTTRYPSACVFSEEHPYSWVDYCNNPADAWPIIVGNGISLYHNHGSWQAEMEYSAPIGAFGTDEICSKFVDHKNPLRAAMVVFLMMQEK